ncbi:MAG: 4'-phosphopantetheinyl transferase family protein [Flavobacteriales bacterium]|jgi:phosphopantetheinyl transferase
MPAEIVHTAQPEMPFTLALWTITESDEALAKLYEQSKATAVQPHFKSTDRNREWLASRLLMQHLHLPPVSYLPNGKPFIAAGYFSLSHCANQVALVLSDTPVGIDIQLPTEQIRRIHTKFCSPSELARFSPTPLREMTIIWSAKEAIFKFWGENVAFAEDIEVAPFDCDDSRITAQYRGAHGNRTFNLWHFEHDTHEIIIAL